MIRSSVTRGGRSDASRRHAESGPKADECGNLSDYLRPDCQRKPPHTSDRPRRKGASEARQPPRARPGRALDFHVVRRDRTRGRRWRSKESRGAWATQQQRRPGCGDSRGPTTRGNPGRFGGAEPAGRAERRQGQRCAEGGHSGSAYRRAGHSGVQPTEQGRHAAARARQTGRADRRARRAGIGNARSGHRRNPSRSADGRRRRF